MYIKKVFLLFAFLILTTNNPINARTDIKTINPKWASWSAQKVGKLSCKTPYVIAAAAGILSGSFLHVYNNADYNYFLPEAFLTLASYYISNQYTTNKGNKILAELAKEYDTMFDKITIEKRSATELLKTYRVFLNTLNSAYPYTDLYEYLITLRQALVDMHTLLERGCKTEDQNDNLFQQKISTYFDCIIKEIDMLSSSRELAQEKERKATEEIRNAQLENMRANTAQQVASVSALHSHANAQTANAANSWITFFQRFFYILEQ